MSCAFRCDCPITTALDIVGDKWILVIIKQMLVERKRTFKEFSESDEAIASNILSSKLKQLESYQLITKSKLPGNKKTNIYRLTAKALDLAPTIVELAFWSDKHLREHHEIMRNSPEMEMIRKDPKSFARNLVQQYINQDNGTNN